MVMLAFALMNFIINPDELMQTFTKLRAPFVMTVIMSLSVRLFPLLNKDLRIISEVQKTRGYEIEKGGWLTRLKNRMYLMLPLLANSLERAIQVSEAMEARAFGISKKRIYLKDVTLRKSDYFILAVNTILLIFILLFGFQGYGVYQIYVQLALPKPVITDGILLVIFLLGNLFIIFLMWIRRYKH
jgi:energy-coupling factor transport system permease protein